MSYRRATTSRTVLTLLAVATAGGCAAKNRQPDLPLPPRDRMAYDAEATLQLAVAERTRRERAALAAARLGTSGPATRPAVIEVPAPQLIPVPEHVGPGFSQGPSAHPLREALATVAGANERATRSPTPSGFLNAIHYYDYAPGVRFNAVAAAGYITTVRLQAGERIQSLSCSDTSGYEIEQVTEGRGDAATTLILIKPKHPRTQSNWVITTSERTYFLDLFVNDEPNFQSAVAWHYPLAGLQVAGEASGAASAGVPSPTSAAGMNLLAAAPDAMDSMPTVAGPMGMDLGDLNFDYALLFQSRGRDGREKRADAPAWAPLRVFDDGRKTFIQFSPTVRHHELPPVFALDHPDSRTAELVNYRRSGDYLVLDRLVVAAELRADEAPQQIVKIVRGKARPVPARGVAEPQRDPQAAVEVAAMPKKKQAMRRSRVWKGGRRR